MAPQTLNLNVGAIVIAGGWNLYDATKIDNLGFGQGSQRHYQYADGTAGGPQRPHRRQDPAAFRWRRTQKRGLCAVRRLPG
jgi:hypothetical protein